MQKDPSQVQDRGKEKIELGKAAKEGPFFPCLVLGEEGVT